ncbi:MAG: hypothetical protein AB8E87_12200, partial [Prochlorococcus sp.]
AMAANPTRVEGLFTQYRLNEQDYLSQLHKVFPSGRGLWVAAEIASNRQMLSNYLAWMILIWRTCLLITLACVSWLVKRIVQPLRQLSEMKENVTAKTLQTSSIKDPCKYSVAFNQNYHKLRWYFPGQSRQSINNEKT